MGLGCRDDHLYLGKRRNIYGFSLACCFGSQGGFAQPPGQFLPFGIEVLGSQNQQGVV